MMKAKLPLLMLFFIVSISGFSQTLAEREKIIASYDQEKVAELTSYLDSLSTARQIEIDNYFNNHPTEKKRYTDENGRLHEVRFISEGRPVYNATLDLIGANKTRVNYINTGGSLGLSLDGQNMHIGIWDGGHARTTHQELQYNQPIPETRVTVGDGTYTPIEHATHVSGIAVARGFVASAKGMAPQATMTSYNWTNDINEVNNEANNNGLLVSNHSYGVPTESSPTWVMGCYDTQARTWDNVAYTYPYYLAVMSAGNSGDYSYTGGLGSGLDKLTYEKNAKNIVVVGSASQATINGNGDLTPGTLLITTFSSQGPTDDGRVKPDIIGWGFNVYSCINTSDSAYGNLPGTSMASPNVAGAMLLLQQYYNQLHGTFMKSSTLKGLASHTADDDHIYTGPDPYFGWGLLNAKKAAETLLKQTQNLAVVSERTLNSSETYTYTFSTDGSGPLSATIAWTDPPGTANDGLVNSTNRALVNDLDIRITGPTSTTYFPWKLQLGSSSVSTTTGDNLVDNIENIDILSPVAGTYTVTVSHKGLFLTNGSQDYSLIITGQGLTLGNEEFSTSEFKVWPNPVNEQLNYSFNSVSQGDINIEISDVNGRLIYSKKDKNLSSTVSGSINMSNFAKGIYFVRIRQGSYVQTVKVVH